MSDVSKDVEEDVFDDAEQHFVEAETPPPPSRLEEVHALLTRLWQEHLNNDPLLSFVALPIALLCLLVYPRWMFALLLIAGGFVAGFAWATGEEHNNAKSATEHRPWHDIYLPSRSSSPTKPSPSLQPRDATLHIDPDSIEFEQLAPSLRQSVVTFLDYFIRDFIDWKEFRNFETTPLTTEEYLQQHTSTALHDEKEINTIVQEISSLLIQRLIPKEDRANAVNQSLLQELISSCVLLPTIDAICDPDFINQTILTFLRKQAAAAEAADDQPLIKPSSTEIEEVHDIDDAIASSEGLQDTSITSFDPSSPTLASLLHISQGFIGFMSYLESLHKDYLLRFWMHAKSLQQFGQVISPDFIREDAVQIFQLHFAPDATEHIALAPALIADCQQRIQSDDPASAFKAVQEEVMRVIEVEHWPGFLQSEAYQQFLQQKDVAVKEAARRQSVTHHLEKEEEDEAKEEHAPIEEGRPSFAPSDLAETESTFSDMDHIKDVVTTQDISGLTSALSSVREQLFWIGESLADTSQRKSRLKKLEERQARLRHQVEELTKMILEQEMGHSDTMRVVDILDVKIDATSFSLQTPRLKTFASNIKNLTVIEFIIEANEGNDAGWSFAFIEEYSSRKRLSQSRLVTRDSVDFVNLQESLKSLFPKTEKIPFPNLRRIGIKQAERDSVAKELETWMRIVLTDASLRQSSFVRNFLNSDAINRQANQHHHGDRLGETDTAAGSGRTIEAARTKAKSHLQRDYTTTAMSAINSAGQMFRKAAQGAGDEEEGGNRNTADFSTEDVDILLETAFTLLKDVFDLKGQFFRRQMLSMVKRYVRQNYGTTLLALMRDMLGKHTSDQALSDVLTMTNDFLWPNGVWGETPPVRSEAVKQETMVEAKTAFLEELPIGGYLKSMLGRYNTMVGCQRLFDLVQERQWNRSLAVNLLKIATTLIFAKT